MIIMAFTFAVMIEDVAQYVVTPCGYRGTVTRVEQNYLTIKLQGGDKLMRVYLCKVLIDGEFPINVAEPSKYRVSDVKLGDLLQISTLKVHDFEICMDLCIYRRPGGRVPPSNAKRTEQRWHIFANTYQDFEERGIPLPPGLANKIPD